MKERRGVAITGRVQNARSFKYHAVEDSDDDLENNFSQGGQRDRRGEHPSIQSLERHLRSFRQTSSNRLVFIIVGVIAVALVLFWAIA